MVFPSLSRPFLAYPATWKTKIDSYAFLVFVLVLTIWNLVLESDKNGAESRSGIHERSVRRPGEASSRVLSTNLTTVYTTVFPQGFAQLTTLR